MKKYLQIPNSGWMSDCCLTPHVFFTSYIIRWDADDARFVLHQYTYITFLKAASSQKQQFADRHVATLAHYPDSEPTILCSYFPK